MYILNEAGEPVRCEQLIEWAKWFEVSESRRKLASDYVTIEDGTVVHVSTIFLGLDHGHGRGRPVLWETMIFGGELHQFQTRYHTRADAIEGHRHALANVLMDAMIVDGKPVHTSDAEHLESR